MAVSHRRWAQSYARVELCVNFVNRLYLGEIILSGAFQGLRSSLKNRLIRQENTLCNILTEGMFWNLRATDTYNL
ncbi:UNVERIFIED_ORG: hypothetical protein J3D59_005485 [Pseudomonas fluorescens]